jgi:hypothetical protein
MLVFLAVTEDRVILSVDYPNESGIGSIWPLNRTSRWATGRPHPLACPLGMPDALPSGLLSGIEKVDPSMWKT